jgi:hypothetical protein
MRRRAAGARWGEVFGRRQAWGRVRARRATRVLAAAVAVGVAWGAVPERARAQAANVANVTVSAAVTARPIQVAGQRDLDFGDIFTGTSVTVPVTGASSGRWRVTGERGAEVRLRFDLPTVLVSGPYTLPIAFGPGSAGYHVRNVPQQATLFDPQAGAVARLRDHPVFPELYVWIGGTVAPPIGQPGGLYLGTVTLSVEYTGN